MILFQNDPFAVNTDVRMSPVPGPSRSRTPTRPSSSSSHPITPVRPSTPSEGRPITPTRPVTPSRPLTPSSRPITPQIGDSLSPHPQEPRSSTPVGFKRHNAVEPTDISSLKSHQSTIKGEGQGLMPGKKKFVSCNDAKKNRVGRSVKMCFFIIFLFKNVHFMHVLC